MALVDYFLKLDGIEGESQDAKHKGEIDLESFSWGVENTGSSVGGGTGAGKVHAHDTHVIAIHSKASPKLELACASGQHIKKAVIIARKAGSDQQEFLNITLSDVLVSAYSVRASPQHIVPVDSITLNFAKVEMEYKEQKPDGTLGGAVKAGWDLKANKKV